jgi:hypothetical protein
VTHGDVAGNSNGAEAVRLRSRKGKDNLLVVMSGIITSVRMSGYHFGDNRTEQSDSRMLNEWLTSLWSKQDIQRMANQARRES